MNSNKKLIQVRLVLENCDSIILSPKEISMLRFGQKSKHCEINDGAWHQHEIIDDIVIILNIDKDKIHYEFGVEEYKTTVFNIFKRRDITQIVVELKEDIGDDSYEIISNHYHVAWCEEDYDNMDYYNKNQITKWVNKSEDENIDKSFYRITINKENS